MIKYLGSKNLLIEDIVNIAKDSGAQTILDVFSGTCRVGLAFREAGFKVISNDNANYARTIASCYLEGENEKHSVIAQKEIKALNALEGIDGYFHKTFSIKSRFFHPKNARRIDAMREFIKNQKYSDIVLENILLTSLIEAADRIDSTCGVQMAYLKEYAVRAHKDICLRMPQLPSRQMYYEIRTGRAMHGDAKDAGLRAGPVDIAYLDPPYNQHSYLGNYHIWESLVLWDKPESYGTACKRMDCKERKSDFNFKNKIEPALRETIKNLQTKKIIISFNDEGYLTEKDICTILEKYGTVKVQRKDYKRYVGASIGIYNPDGEKVGKVGKLTNQELFFIVDDVKQ